MEHKSLKLSIAGVMSMIFGLMLTMYSTFGLKQTGYYLADIRLHIVVTHPYLEIGVLLITIGTLAAVAGMVIDE